MEIKNGATVHRIWGSLEDAELIAVFQYVHGAQIYCEAAIEREPPECSLVWVCHYSGKMNIVRRKHTPPTESPQP